MLYYENIPSIVQETIGALYRESYVDATAAINMQFLRGFDSGDGFAAIKLVLSQLSLVVCIVLVAFIAFVAIQRRALKMQAATSVETVGGEVQPAPVPTGVLRDRWNAIVAHLDSVREADWKNAVIEADKLVDDALARAGFPGATFGDRLSNIQSGALLSLDGVWWAHKVRNRLAHELDYFLRYTEAKQAVGYYEAALAELQLI